MKTSKTIPISKLHRTTKLVTTGAKVGVNYLKYYGDKMVHSEEEAKERLDENNASDIYDSLKTLKGSALKMAQLMSMEKNIMPKAFVDKFSLSQFSVPPLSAPLVLKTFKKTFGKFPHQLFDKFNSQAINAASIGQVHQAEKNGETLAVKIQYPGVAQSIKSDLAIVKPVAMKMFNIQGEHSEQYFKELENKLVEETDYVLELSQSQEITQSCRHLPNLRFPSYYPEYSSSEIITMDWMNGIHLSEFTERNTNQDHANAIGQTLWDFYMYQIHVLRKVHADPHPGNFLISEQGEVIVLDFGCIKEIPEEFYVPYFKMFRWETLQSPERFRATLFDLEILKDEDSLEEQAFFTEAFLEIVGWFTKPFHGETFDFSDTTFFNKISEFGEQYLNKSNLKNMNANRGSKHIIYMNRTFFGLFRLLFDLKAKNIKINNYTQFSKVPVGQGY
nr:AarF/ABC1/UbiB kinase family protein [uncultured Allomuricauda sp.]